VFTLRVGSWLILRPAVGLRRRRWRCCSASTHRTRTRQARQRLKRGGPGLPTCLPACCLLLLLAGQGRGWVGVCGRVWAASERLEPRRLRQGPQDTALISLHTSMQAGSPVRPVSARRAPCAANKARRRRMQLLSCASRPPLVGPSGLAVSAAASQPAAGPCATHARCGGAAPVLDAQPNSKRA
jgi:hypothetical protein